MKCCFFLACVQIASCPDVDNAAMVTKDGSNPGAIHTAACGGDLGNGQFTEFHASGNDDYRSFSDGN